MLLIFFRILFFIVFFLAMLRVKKTRLRHFPSRRTRVSRHQGEPCVWLDRFVSASLDMLRETMQEDASDYSSSRRSHVPPMHKRTDKWMTDDAAEHLASRHRLIGLFEERVKAMLEDRGIASYADCCVHSVGDQPPIIRAIHVRNLTGTEPPAARGDAHAATVSSPSKGAKAKSGEDTNSVSTKGKGGEDSVDGRLADAVTHEEGIAGPSAIELEADVEYTGGVDVSLCADICLPRGRLLPAMIRVSDVKYIKAHVRVRATLQYERATMDSQRRPYLQCTFWLESEPAFSFKLHTLLFRYKIQDCFLVPLVVKVFLLRFVRRRLLWSKGEGFTVPIPLPEGIVDGGIQEWWSGNNDAATKATSTVNPGSFSRKGSIGKYFA